MVPEREERRDVAIGAQDDVAALAAVAAVRSAAGNVRLAAERHGPGAAVPTPHVDLRLVDKLTHEARIRSDAFLNLALRNSGNASMRSKSRRRACGPSGGRTGR